MSAVRCSTSPAASDGMPGQQPDPYLCGCRSSSPEWTLVRPTPLRTPEVQQTPSRPDPGPEAEKAMADPVGTGHRRTG